MPLPTWRRPPQNDDARSIATQWTFVQIALPEKPGSSRSRACMKAASCGGLVHILPAAPARRLLLVLGQLGHEGVARQKQRGDAHCVLQREVDDLWSGR